MRLNIKKIVYCLFSLIVFFFGTGLHENYLLALSDKDLGSLIKGTEWHDPDSEDCGTSGSSPVAGTSEQAVTGTQTSGGIHDIGFVKGLDETKAAAAINAYIQRGYPDSPFASLGGDFISGAKKSNINPFLAVAHLEIESGFATAKTGWGTIPGSHNGFGQTASSSQPHVKSSSGRRVYVWSSWVASINSNSEEDWFAGMNRKFNDPTHPYYHKFNISDYIYQYAPPSENDTPQYVIDFYHIIDKVIVLMDNPNLQNTNTPTSSSSSGVDSNSTPSCINTNAGSSVAGNFIDGFLVYNQYDSRWADKPYGSSIISKSGCYPSAMAMVINAFGKKNPDGSQVTPVETAIFSAENGWYNGGGGTSWAMPIPTGRNWGLNGEEMGTPTSQQIVDKLNQGYLIAATGKGPRPFTKGGHIIVIRGYRDGKFLVGDSGHRDTSDKDWDPAAIIVDINQAWAFKD